MEKRKGKKLWILVLAVVAVLSGCSRRKEIPKLEAAESMEEEQLKEAVKGFGRDVVLKAWGEPDGSLSGMFGDIYLPEPEKTLTVYYSGDNPVVVDVKIGAISHTFEGTVIEANEKTAVVEVDEGFPIGGAGSQVTVGLEGMEQPAGVGDRVRVTYEGGVMETFPLQLEKQLSIQILDDGEVPDETEEEAESWDSRVSKAILSENKGRYTEEECAAEGHRILDMEEGEKETKLYVLTMYGAYAFENGNFVKTAGSGVIPAVLVFQKEEDGEYVLDSFEVTEDGGGYLESIQRMFPKELQEICISPTEEVREDLERQERCYASQYLKELGRKAEIGQYRDFEYPILTDVGVSVEVSNRMIENRAISAYPSWIGDLEQLEDGVRYVYRQEYEPEKKRILLTKTEYDSGKVKEVFEFNSETGDPLVNNFPGVGMTLVEAEATGIQVEMLNTTDLEVDFGEDYELQEFVDGEWVRVPYRIENWAFNSVAYSMPKDQPVKWETDWETFHGVLNPGFYRLVKTVFDFRGAGDYTEYKLTVNFEIGANERKEVSLLKEPPVLHVGDPLSSTMKTFEVQTGNYTWYRRTETGGKMEGITACGLGPLDEAKEKEKLRLKRYNKMEEPPCSLFWEERPDRITVKEYKITDLGNSEAEAVSVTDLEDSFITNMKPDRVYEISAEWKEENQDERGFYGKASYVVVTE